ncbi:MAG: ATP-binding protein [Acidobacteria bacterium]|nr:ATP-binding protein [Acidobacteriota bacterium]MYH21973.1 ATP-binding protein [Acidobacteriota bacterium]MYK79628.1 ATP-binding protein [Acidobacteriota bacterium]
MKRRDGEIIPPELAIKAMRDSGYKNTAYALAELIDNSVQANASHVEIICVEAYRRINERSRRRIQAIGILDNGDGMLPETARLALQFGNGTHLTDRKGIGRFGMGLPNSSISQCRRVEVWTWQSGPDNAMYTYLDVDEIERRRMFAVPSAVHKRVPHEWRARSEGIATAGTLVVWTKFDDHRLSWRGALATLRNTESLIGRMYRKFIDDGRLSIRLLALLEGETDPLSDAPVRVNDPLYLMSNSSTPVPFDKEPMFQTWGDGEEMFSVNYDGATHDVIVRMSWARKETVPGDKSDRGARPYGKHAAKNIGLSIVREGRELDLDPSWTNSYDPTERWWGVEVEFPSTLDEVFGVTNTKQNATIFSNMAQFDWSSEANPGESMSEFRERIQTEGDPRALLLPVVDHIRQQIQEVRKRLKKQTTGRRKQKERHDKPTMEDLATTKFRKRAEQGHPTDADRAEFTEEDRKRFEQDLKDDKHYSEDVAENIANATLQRKRKVVFLTKAMDGYAFFNVEHKQGGLTAVVFSTNHPFYEQLMESLEPNIGDESDADLIDRIHKAADTLELLFAAWARYEMEEIQQQNRLFEMRQEWGKMARFFLTEQDDE